MKFHDLIGAPYRKDGRGPDAWDCAGLVVELQRRQGRELVIPNTPDGELQQGLSMARILRHGWKELPKPEPGCVVYFPTEFHVGTMLDRHRFIHASDDGQGVIVESLHSPRWRGKRHSLHEPC